MKINVKSHYSPLEVDKLGGGELEFAQGARINTHVFMKHFSVIFNQAGHWL